MAVGEAHEPTRVVLVEDDEATLKRLAGAVPAEEYAVEPFSDPAEALARLRGGPRPAVVVVDHLMPGMTGVEFARALRSEGIEIPIVLMTGITLRSVERDQLAEYGVTLVRKPLPSVDLLAVLRRVSPS